MTVVRAGRALDGLGFVLAVWVAWPMGHLVLGSGGV
jgi:hypothetical protein